MKTMIITICLTLAVLAACPSMHADAATLSAEARSGMAREAARGGNEVLQCARGKNSDQAIVTCLNSALDRNILAETDSLPFLAGAYFAAWARLTSSEATAGVKEKWLAVSFKRFSELRGETGLTDSEISDATGISYFAVRKELERQR